MEVLRSCRIVAFHRSNNLVRRAETRGGPKFEREKAVPSDVVPFPVLETRLSFQVSCSCFYCKNLKFEDPLDGDFPWQVVVAVCWVDDTSWIVEEESDFSP